MWEAFLILVWVVAVIELSLIAVAIAVTGVLAVLKLVKRR